MAITGPGTSRHWLTPIGPDGRRLSAIDPYDLSAEGTDKVVGNWTGHQRGNNLRNPRPGYQYQYAGNNSQELAAAQARGWELVRRSDPDHPLFVDSPDGPTPLNDYCATRDVVLVRIPSTRLAENRADEEAARLAGIARSGRRWHDSASPEERAAGYGRNTRLVADRHQVSVAEGSESNIQDMFDDDAPRDRIA